MKRFLAPLFLIRVGLACVFLANSLTAFLNPSEFQELVASSFVAGLLPICVVSFVVYIGFNDLIVATLLFAGWRTPYVARYATAWLVGVTIVIGVFSLDALEHLGFISMALALALQKQNTSNEPRF